MTPLNDLLPGPYVPVRVTRGALVAHRYTYAPPRCRTLQYSRTFILLSVSLWNDLADPVFDGVGLPGFKSRADAFYWQKLLYPYYSLLLFFPISSYGWLVLRAIKIIIHNTSIFSMKTITVKNYSILDRFIIINNIP